MPVPRSMRASLATACPNWVFMATVSPGRCRVRSVCRKLRLSALMTHLSVDSVVSTAAVSLRAMSRRASVRRAPFTSTVSLSRSMPFERSHSSPTSPLILRSLIKPLVLTFASCRASWLMTTRFSNRGRNCTSTVRCLASAMVSVTLGRESLGCRARKLSMPRLSGHSSLT